MHTQRVNVHCTAAALQQAQLGSGQLSDSQLLKEGLSVISLKRSDIRQTHGTYVVWLNLQHGR
jgi:hypothetical protein